jgi:hypothetical protein
MTQKINLKISLVSGLVLLSLGGWLLHLRTHPLSQMPENNIAFISGIISVVIVPLLFLSTRTVQYAYLLNGFTVIIGTITMAHFSLTHLPSALSLSTLFLMTTLADILLLWGKFVLGKALFDLTWANLDKDLPRQVKTFKFPNMGWWWVHLAGFSLVYALGNIFWR